MASTRPRTTKTCKKAVSNFLPEDKDKKIKDKEEDDDKEEGEKTMDYQDPSRTVNIIFGGEGCLSRRMGKTNCSRDTINGTCHTKISQAKRGPNFPISFSTEDQWTNFFEPGKLSLLLDPVVAGVRLTKALIDSGSGLNILFASTLCQMGLEFSKIRPTK